MAFNFHFTCKKGEYKTMKNNAKNPCAILNLIFICEKPVINECDNNNTAPGQFTFVFLLSVRISAKYVCFKPLTF